MDSDIPGPRSVRGLLSILDSSPNRIQQLYCLYRSIRWWVEKCPDLDGSASLPLGILANWSRLERATTADRLEQLEAWGLILVERAAATRNAPPRARYRLGDITTLRSCLRSWCKSEGMSANMADVVLRMTGLGEGGQAVSVLFEERDRT